MKRSVLYFAVSAVALCFANRALGVEIEATITADNHYGLYYGQADGGGLTFVGRNEFGGAGSPGTFNWSEPETFSFSAGAGDYLYILAWNDAATQMWIGEFNLPGGGLLLSNTSDWKYWVSGGDNPGPFGDLPPLATVMADISGATWAVPAVSAPQGTSPWGTIPDISSSAEFVWHDTFQSHTVAKRRAENLATSTASVSAW